MSKLLLFFIILSVIILGSYLNYPIEKLTIQGDNGVNYDNYDKCIDNAKKQHCSSLNTDKDVITQICNPNWLAKGYILDVKCDDLSKDQCYVKKLKRLCLNNYQDDPRGFGCKSDNFGEQGDIPNPVTGCDKDDKDGKNPESGSGGKSPWTPNRNPSASDQQDDWSINKCFNHFKETKDLNPDYKLCDRLTEKICLDNCGNYCKWKNGECKSKKKYKDYKN
jgi:hypothetical protein